MYGKITNGNLILAPKTLTIEGILHYHPSDALYEQAGYLQVVDTPYPETDVDSLIRYTYSYEEQNGKIVKVWVEVTAEPEIEKAPTVEERVQALENRVAELNEKIDSVEA